MFLLSTNRPYCVLFAGWSRKCKPKANNGFASKIERTCKIFFSSTLIIDFFFFIFNFNFH